MILTKKYCLPTCGKAAKKGDEWLVDMIAVYNSPAYFFNTKLW